MSEDSQACSIAILDKEYIVVCPEDERDALHRAAELINGKMQVLRDGGKVIGTERIAVMTALNIAHEMLQSSRENSDYNDKLGADVRRMQDKIALVLHKTAVAG